jgi:glycerol-3-phosphate acyltransferase PlsY
VILRRRKLYRIGAGIVFPVVYYFSPNKIIVEMLLFYLLGIMTTLEVMRYVSPSLWRTVAEHSKGILKVRQGMITGTTALLIANIIIIAFFNKQVAIVSLVYMLFGDTASAIVGTKYGKVKMGNKSLEGSLAFFITVMVLALIFYRWTGIRIHLVILTFGAIAATITEALPIEINDNLTVPLVAAIVMQVFL